MNGHQIIEPIGRADPANLRKISDILNCMA